MLVFMLQKILSLRVTRVKYSAPLSPRWGKNYYGQPHTSLHLCLVSPSTSFMCMFHLFFFVLVISPAGLEYKLQRVESFTKAPLQILLKQRKTGEKGLSCYVWTRPSAFTKRASSHPDWLRGKRPQAASTH